MLFVNGLGVDTSPTSGLAATSQIAPTTKLALRARATSFGPTGGSRFVPITITPQYTCSTNGCVATNEPTRNLFKALQALIELVARKKGWTPSNWWSTTPQTGVIDSRTASNYLIIVNSGAPFGPMIDARVDAKLVASSAAQFANTMAQWLGISVPMPAPPPLQPRTFQCPGGSFVQVTQPCPDGKGFINSQGQYVAYPPPPPATTAPSSSTPPPATTAQSAPPQPQESVPATTAQSAPPQPQEPAPPQPQEPAPPAVVKSQAKYREGCVARFNKTRKIFSIYCPLDTALGYAYYDNLAETLLAPSAEPPPAGMIKEGEELTVPTCATASGEATPCPKTPDSERDKGFFRLHNPWMWVTLAGVAGVVGGTGYVVYRRRSQTRSRPNQW